MRLAQWSTSLHTAATPVSQCQHLPLVAGGPSNEVSNEPLCSHANAKEKERALGQFTPLLACRMGICCEWGRAEGVRKGVESKPRIEVVALEGSQDRSQA